MKTESERMTILVCRAEADFDRACDEAMRRASLIIPDTMYWQEYHVVFKELEHLATPTGREWYYVF